jgi:arginine decarboxylase
MDALWQRGAKMTQESDGELRRIDAFFSTPAARADRWRELVDVARSWASGTADRSAFEAAYNEAAAIEEFHAYPGPQLMAALRHRAESGDASGTAILAWRISAALLSRSFRQHAADWDPHAQVSGVVADVLPPTRSRAALFRGADRYRRAGRALALHLR